MLVSYDQNSSLFYYVKYGYHVRLRHPSCVYITAQKQYTALQKMRNFPCIITLSLIRFKVLSLTRFNVLSLPRFKVLCLAMFKVFSLTRFKALSLARFKVMSITRFKVLSSL